MQQYNILVCLKNRTRKVTGKFCISDIYCLRASMINNMNVQLEGMLRHQDELANFKGVVEADDLNNTLFPQYCINNLDVRHFCTTFGLTHFVATVMEYFL